MRFFQGIHWLALWALLYVVFMACAKSTDFLVNIAAQLIAFAITIAAMWIREQLR
jgi:hypothetical protein